MSEEASEELRLEELEARKTPMWTNSSDKNGKHFGKLSSIKSEDFDEEELEKKLRMLYAQFFSSEYKGV